MIDRVNILKFLMCKIIITSVIMVIIVAFRIIYVIKVSQACGLNKPIVRGFKTSKILTVHHRLLFFMAF
jgi:hypothetical protein